MRRISANWILAIATSVTLGIPGLLPAQSAGTADLDPGASQTGPADCSRILWVGGYRQQDPGNCPPKARGKPGKRPGYSDKDKKQRDRKAHEDFREERKAKREAEKAREKQAREDRKAKDEKARRCRGLGLPANCTEPNPGHASGTSSDAPGKTKGKAKKK